MNINSHATQFAADGGTPETTAHAAIQDFAASITNFAAPTIAAGGTFGCAPGNGAGGRGFVVQVVNCQ